MTVKEYIALLRKLPQDALMFRSHEGDWYEVTGPVVHENQHVRDAPHGPECYGTCMKKIDKRYSCGYCEDMKWPLKTIVEVQ